MTPRPIPSKVARLIPMLGSDADHEALSAVRAIGRILDRSGLGFTDLAAAIPADETNVDNVHVERPAGPVPPFNVYAWRRAYTPRQEQDHRAHVRFCQNHMGHLTPWEVGFVQSVARLHGNLSIRQGDRLAAIVDRIGREARHA
jgi:hypothetical protein